MTFIDQYTTTCYGSPEMCCLHRDGYFFNHASKTCEKPVEETYPKNRASGKKSIAPSKAEKLASNRCMEACSPKQPCGSGLSCKKVQLFGIWTPICISNHSDGPCCTSGLVKNLATKDCELPAPFKDPTPNSIPTLPTTTTTTTDHPNA